MKSYSIRVILAAGTATDAVVLIRSITGMPLSQTAALVKDQKQIDIPADRFEEFVGKAVCLGISIVHGPVPLPYRADATDAPVSITELLEEIKQVRHDIGGLRRHLGMLPHQ